MSYLDHLHTARYISPSGKLFYFKFNDLNRASGKKAPVHEFPQQDEPNVQDLGNMAIRFAIEVFFIDADYDVVADSFWSALAEKGPATLLHPRWGNLSVLPLTYDQRESFVAEMGQAVFKIEFARVGEVEYPITTVQTEVVIGDSLDAIAWPPGDPFFYPADAADSAIGKGSLLDALNDYSEGISTLISGIESFSEEINRRVSEFESTMDTLILSPEVLAQSFIQLYRLPGRAAVKIIKKVDGYWTMLENLASYLDPETYFQAAIRTFLATGILAGMAESTLAGDLTSRPEAIRAAEVLQTALAAATELIESAEGSVPEYTAPSEMIARLRDIFARAVAMLLEKSFSLKAERRISLEGDRTPLDLIYELYGDIDHLDEFIEQNRLQGDEIFLIPRGREVAYYV